jgi:hypothetical protein
MKRGLKQSLQESKESRHEKELFKKGLFAGSPVWMPHSS